jgi:hypothetical protein
VTGHLKQTGHCTISSFEDGLTYETSLIYNMFSDKSRYIVVMFHKQDIALPYFTAVSW